MGETSVNVCARRRRWKIIRNAGNGAAAAVAINSSENKKLILRRFEWKLPPNKRM
jgi:hypothetical protein